MKDYLKILQISHNLTDTAEFSINHGINNDNEKITEKIIIFDYDRPAVISAPFSIYSWIMKIKMLLL